MALNSNYNNQLTDFFNPNSNFGQNVETPYVKGMSTFMPQPMAGNITQDDLYPLQSSLQTPQLDSPVISSNIQGFKKGGEVRKSRKKYREEIPNIFPMLSEMIRQQGGEEDTVLAHINPLEAQMLGVLAQGGRVNPITGLPQFGLFDNPKKWLKGSAGGIGGAILGNILLPGIGGVIGGALGGAAGSKIRGRKDYVQAGIRGAAIGTGLPTVSSLLGTGATQLGMTSAGKYLTDYGARNGILQSLGMSNPLKNIIGSGPSESLGTSNLARMGSPSQNAGRPSESSIQDLKSISGGDVEPVARKSWGDKFLEPKNLLTALTLGGSLMNRPKKESAEKKGKDQALKQKAYDKAMQLTPQERALREADMLSEKQMLRRLERNKYLPEERYDFKPTYRKVNSPEEYARSKRWVQYYDNPNFQGNPLTMKKGGIVPEIMFEEEEINYPTGKGFYFKGHTKGQEDKIPTELNQGDFIIPADVVAHAGDGNNEAGAISFNKFIKDIGKSTQKKNPLLFPLHINQNIKIPAYVGHGEFRIPHDVVYNLGKGNSTKGATFLDKLVKNIRTSKGGKAILPPKIKPLINYMR